MVEAKRQDEDHRAACHRSRLLTAGKTKNRSRIVRISISTLRLEPGPGNTQPATGDIRQFSTQAAGEGIR